MRTDMERIALMHQKAQMLEEQKKLRIWGSVSVCLFALLLTAIVQVDIPFQSILNSGLAGSSLLGESAGGYVLVAVISFIAAVCITVYCLRRPKV